MVEKTLFYQSELKATKILRYKSEIKTFFPQFLPKISTQGKINFLFILKYSLKIKKSFHERIVESVDPRLLLKVW